MAKNIRQLLEQARAFHKDLGVFYDRLGQTADKSRVKLLLEYMSRHEEYLEQCLVEYGKGANTQVLDTWMKFTPEMASPACLADSTGSPPMTIADVVALALKMDECLVRFYQQVGENAHSEGVRELFTQLMRLEKSEELLTVRNALEMEEV